MGDQTQDPAAPSPAEATQVDYPIPPHLADGLARTMRLAQVPSTPHAVEQDLQFGPASGRTVEFEIPDPGLVALKSYVSQPAVGLMGPDPGAMLTPPMKKYRIGVPQDMTDSDAIEAFQKSEFDRATQQFQSGDAYNMAKVASYATFGASSFLATGDFESRFAAENPDQATVLDQAAMLELMGIETAGALLGLPAVTPIGAVGHAAYKAAGGVVSRATMKTMAKLGLSEFLTKSFVFGAKPALQQLGETGWENVAKTRSVAMGRAVKDLGHASPEAVRFMLHRSGFSAALDAFTEANPKIAAQRIADFSEHLREHGARLLDDGTILVAKGFPDASVTALKAQIETLRAALGGKVPMRLMRVANLPARGNLADILQHAASFGAGSPAAGAVIGGAFGFTGAALAPTAEQRHTYTGEIPRMMLQGGAAGLDPKYAVPFYVGGLVQQMTLPARTVGPIHEKPLPK